MAVRLAAGRLRHKVDILNVTESVDEYGDSTQSTTVERTVHAEVMPMTFSIAERLAKFGAQVTEDITHRVVIRHYDGLTAKHKIRYRGRVLEIASLSNVGEQGVMDEILCRELVDG